jgi:multiple sugar transport system permease protein
MKPQLMFGAVLTISGALGVGASLAGNPSVEYSAYFITMHMSSFASERYEMGYACAIATIMFLIMILCNRLFRKILNKIGS